jgi:hypothetical protein
MPGPPQQNPSCRYFETSDENKERLTTNIGRSFATLPSGPTAETAQMRQTADYKEVSTAETNAKQHRTG